MATPEFILKLREKIGHDQLWLPGVTAVVVRDVPEGAPAWETPKVLLVKRADDGQWTPVTGIVDPDEQPHDAAVREVFEETRVEATVEALLGVGAVGPVEYSNGDVSSYVDTAYRLSVTGNADAVVGDDESTEVGWFEVAQLPPMQPRFRLVCADAVAQLRHPAGFKPRMGFHKRPRD
ncbi:NUDIX domain-containing protein [Corynebacterium renale]|uniref:ADP-ribose pyrophosphatase YjhB (NUDIX family) n=1 Tax=Corynebacterium renale TaxID=1724 RepID=A0A2A9DR23_9CORY|nr:NUDIX domain-containing protein [Corynebacterium renale]PFG28350.1 ADP-ribose pyrophosphatase YjhB (NUDIX family) [Corynebacterium renale]SQG65056.1 NUDIX domain-containing protein [Corynebacterium renale]SQI18939.1 NUDIX domain-containing protein [Corynebacterium renale]STC97287.1 NUDIX domain-containing protein [Corynebacterium renale]